METEDKKVFDVAFRKFGGKSETAEATENDSRDDRTIDNSDGGTRALS